MAVKVKIDVRKFRNLFKKLKTLSGKELIDRKTANIIGKVTIKSMKALISKGISPIRGLGLRTRFPKYKNPDRYPGDRKGKRPVNLKLTGQMLGSLKSKLKPAKTGFSTDILLNNSFANDKEDGHRKGTNKQPKRPILLKAAKKEKFAATIEKKQFAIYNKRIGKLIKKPI